jgi:hypothetical protein
MKRLIILCLVLISTLAPNLAAEVRAQKLSENLELFPATLRFEVPVRRPSAAAGAITPKTRAISSSPVVDFGHHPGSLAVSRTVSFSLNSHKNSLENLTTFIAISKDIISWAPPGLKIDSGLSYFLPVNRHFSAFATLKPSLTNLFTAPQTMVETGFQIPLAHGTPGKHDVSLKFSTSVDQQFRPVVSFSLNLTPFGR